MTHDIVLSLSGHHITVSPLLPLISAPDVTCLMSGIAINIASEMKTRNSSIHRFSTFCMLFCSPFLRSMLKVRKSYKYFDQRKTPNIYNFPLANNADENKESCTIKHCLFKDNYLGPVWIHLHIHTERMVLDFGIRASFYTIIIT